MPPSSIHKFKHYTLEDYTEGLFPSEWETSVPPSPLKTLTRFFRKSIYRRAIFLGLILRVLSRFLVIIIFYYMGLIAFCALWGRTMQPVFSQCFLRAILYLYKRLPWIQRLCSSIQSKRIVQITTHTHHLVLRNK